MKKLQYDYYEDELFFDEMFLLELNLQNIRRDLVGLLEGYDPRSCFECNQIECCCSNESSTFDSITLSTLSSDSNYPLERDRSMDAYYNIAPPPETLPMPKWKPQQAKVNDPQEPKPTDSVSTVATWMNASIPSTSQSDPTVNFPVPNKLESFNYTWPPSPMSIWSGEMLKKTTEKEVGAVNGKEKVGNNSVDEFFKYFKKDTRRTKSNIF